MTTLYDVSWFAQPPPPIVVIAGGINERDGEANKDFADDWEIVDKDNPL